jgi:hypothetical protein
MTLTAAPDPEKQTCPLRTLQLLLRPCSPAFSEGLSFRAAASLIWQMLDVGAALVETVASKAPSCVELWNDRLEYEVPIATNKFGRSLWRRPPEESWGPHQAEVIGAAALLPDRTFNPCSPAELEIFRWTYEGCMEDEPSAQHERSDDALVIALVRWRSCRPTYCELHREGLWMVEGGRWVMRQGFAKRRSYWVHRAGM